MANNTEQERLKERLKELQQQYADSLSDVYLTDAQVNALAEDLAPSIEAEENHFASVSKMVNNKDIRRAFEVILRHTSAKFDSAADRANYVTSSLTFIEAEATRRAISELENLPFFYKYTPSEDRKSQAQIFIESRINELKRQAEGGK